MSITNFNQPRMNHMKMEFRCIVLITMLFVSCKSKMDDQIVGVYVHELSFEDKKLDSEKILGKVLMRDTILITQKEKCYQIENRVWRNRSYDQNGWQRVFETAIKIHTVTYDKIDQSLNTEMGLYNPMYLDFEKGLLYYRKDGEKKWRQVR